ncbi:MAG TPA: PAS domain-containing methyl-accepting chemotaxis protein [Azospira sp.]|nr:PAS domain-containing methyl-accepting chemotaxis protein [Azospira sp.]
MRFNLPVTLQEHTVPAGVSIVSKTDLRGIITYANDAFVDISGYRRDELIGQPHNLLRHPDMPAQAFAHMWEVLEQGNPWKGIVKNRTRDGGFYWVKAVVVPIRKDDKTIGYMSVREAASPEEILAAEALYRELNHSGEAIKGNVLHRLMTIRTGFFLGSLFVIFLMIMGGILGIGGLMLSNTTVETLYTSRIDPLTKASQLDAEAQQLRNDLMNHFGPNLHPAEDKGSPGKLQQVRQRMEGLLEELQHIPLAEADTAILKRVVREYGRLQQLVLLPLEGARAEGAGGDMPMPGLNGMQAYFDQLHLQLSAFQQSIQAASDRDYTEMRERNRLIWNIALAGIVIGILVVLVVGRFFLRDIVTPLQSAIVSFDRIAQGDLSGEVEVYGKGETGQLIRASAIMQMHLKVITDEIYLVAKGIQEHCSQLNGALFEISDHSEIQHDRLSQARSVLSDAQFFSRDLEQMLASLKALAVSPPEDEPGEVLSLIERIENSIRLQSFAFEDFLGRIEQISELVVDNRQDTQGAYAMSECLQSAADHLNELVSYFSGPPVAVPALVQPV